LFAFIKCDTGRHVEIYTDGSKTGEAVGCAAVCNGDVKSMRLPNQCNIYTAELHAIRLAYDFIRRSREASFAIYSDSLSSLQAMQHFQIDNEIVLDILKVHSQLTDSGKRIVLCWVPSHVGIRGNERADASAKASLSLSTAASLKIPAKCFYPYANKLYTKEWQEHWKKQTENKLYAVNPTIGRIPKLKGLGRREQTIITRLRIGHTRLTHSYLMSADSPPECTACKCLLTVEHLLLECSSLSRVRLKHFSCGSLKELFEDIDPRCIIDFIKESHFYHRI
jgi:kelch-like protein 2/3